MMILETFRVRRSELWIGLVCCVVFGTGKWLGAYAKDCYTGWKLGVRSLFNDPPQEDEGDEMDTPHLNGLTYLPPDAPVAFREAGFAAAQHKAIFDTCTWANMVTHHDGVCSHGLSTPEVRCVKFRDTVLSPGQKDEFEFDLSDAEVWMPRKVSDGGGRLDRVRDLFSDEHAGTPLSNPMDVYDILAYSSLAYAESTSASFAVKWFAKGNWVRPPQIKVSRTHDGQEVKIRGCDSGGLCNLPLS